MASSEDPQPSAERLHFSPVPRFRPILRHAQLARVSRAQPVLTCIVAGSGTGKSMFAAQYANTLLSDAHGDGVWISLTEDHSSLRQLSELLITAFTQAGLVAPEGANTTVEQAFRSLPHGTVVVLDNFHHVIDIAVEEVLLAALEQSARVKIVITSRTSPPLLTSARTQLTVPTVLVEADDLNFTPEEVRQLLEIRRPTLSSEHALTLAQDIFESTRGWAIAVQASCIQRGSARHSAQQGLRAEFIRDYVHHATDGLPTAHRRIVVALGICGEVTAQQLARVADVSADQAMDFLTGATEVDLNQRTDENEDILWLTHDLVATQVEESATRLIGSDQLRIMRRRVVDVMQHTQPRTAAIAALRSESWAALEELLQRKDSANEPLVSPQHPASKQFRAIPSAVLREYPTLKFFHMLAEYAAPGAAPEKLLTMLSQLGSRKPETGPAAYGAGSAVGPALRMATGRLLGRESFAVQMAEVTSARLATGGTGTMESSTSHLVSNQVAITYIMSGQFDDAEEQLSRNDSFVRPNDTHQAHTIALRSWSHAWRGDLNTARSLVDTGRARATPTGWHNSYAGAGFRIASSLLALEDGRPAEAREDLAALSEHIDTIEYWPQLYTLDALITESTDGPREALLRLEWLLSRKKMKKLALASSRRLLSETHARLAWHAGTVVRPPRGRTGAPLADVYEHLFYGRAQEALLLVTKMLADPSTAGVPRRRSELLLLQAKAAWMLGDDAKLDAAVRQAHRILLRNSMTLPLRVVSADAFAAFL